MVYDAPVNNYQGAEIGSKKRGLEDMASNVEMQQEEDMVVDEKQEEPVQPAPKKRFNPFAKNVDQAALDEELKAQELEREALEAVMQDDIVEQ